MDWQRILRFARINLGDASKRVLTWCSVGREENEPWKTRERVTLEVASPYRVKSLQGRGTELHCVKHCLILKHFNWLMLEKCRLLIFDFIKQPQSIYWCFFQGYLNFFLPRIFLPLSRGFAQGCFQGKKKNTLFPNEFLILKFLS